jgi:HTH-type transcriptional regulator/antitoxin HipB
MTPTSGQTAAQVGGLLVSRRNQLALTQSEVAARLAWSQNRISELETQPATLTVEQLLAYLNLLGLELSISPRPGDLQKKVEW